LIQPREARQRTETLAEIVKKLREEKGLSQEKLARLADVSNNTIVNIEAGKQNNPTIETLKRVAKALEVSVDVLIK
jgi:transcriptional regulator with XRE-family HTH domain